LDDSEFIHKKFLKKICPVDGYEGRKLKSDVNEKLLPNAGLRPTNNVVGCIKPPMYWKNFPKPCSPRSKQHCTISGKKKHVKKLMKYLNCIARFNPTYPKAMECLAKDKASMPAFYDYLAENWQHIRTTNPV